MKLSVKYIQDASKIIERTIDSSALDKKEKSDAIKALISTMTENPFIDSGRDDSCENYYYKFMVNYMDKELTDLFSQEFINQILYNKARVLVDVQRANIVFLKIHKIEFEKLNNPDLDEYLKLMNIKFNNTTLIEKTKNKEYEIFEKFRYRDAFSSSEFNTFFALVSEYESLINECRNNKLDCSRFRFNKVNEFKLDVQEFQKKYAKRQALYVELLKLDKEIVLLDETNEYNEELLNKLIEKCHAMNELMLKCKKKSWDLPPVIQCSSPGKSIDRYLLYKKMIETDKVIYPIVNAEDISKLKRLRTLCLAQRINIQTCNINNWKIPNLKVAQIDYLYEQSNHLIDVATKSRRKKITLTIVLISIVLIFSSVIWGNIYYKSTHSKINYSTDEIIGMNYRKAMRIFNSAGFENVREKEVDEGYLPSGQVCSVTINSNSNIVAGRSYRNDADVTIRYSSSDRIDITNIVDSWESEDYRNLIGILELRQFDVDVIEVFNDSLSYNGETESLIINGVPYQGGTCCVPPGCSIEFYVYALAIRIDDDPDFFIGRNYESVLDDLEEMGFDNIIFERTDDLITGFVTREESIESIEINNSSSFDEDDVFCHDVEIVITVHTFSGRHYPHIPD